MENNENNDDEHSVTIQALTLVDPTKAPNNDRSGDDTEDIDSLGSRVLKKLEQQEQQDQPPSSYETYASASAGKKSGTVGGHDNSTLPVSSSHQDRQHHHQHHPSSSSSTMVSSSSVTITNSAATIGAGGSSHHRPSRSEVSAGSIGSIGSSGSRHSQHHEDLQHKKTPRTKAKTKDRSSSFMAKARLVLQVVRTPIPTGPSSVQHQQQPQIMTLCQTDLDFRPLGSPCIVPIIPTTMQRGGGGNDEGGDPHSRRQEYGVWVGSADDTRLRLYHWVIKSDKDNDEQNNNNNNQKSTLVPVENLPSEHFSVNAPVMAIDYHQQVTSALKESNDDNDDDVTAMTTALTTHTLALACQDGTIKLITWEEDQNHDGDSGGDDTYNDNVFQFQHIQHFKIIIDGPLVCLRLEHSNNNDKEEGLLRVVVGSLCGYVCQLSYDWERREWDGPWMIVQGFWNTSTSYEDGVLAVDVSENYVAVGTHAGRCLLYATQDSETYFKVWDAILPYSVHEVLIVRNGDNKNDGKSQDNLGNTRLTLAVTTRRSFHVFQCTRGSVPWRKKPSKARYNADLVHSRLTEILQDVKREKEALLASNRVEIEKTLEDLVARVVESMPEEIPVDTFSLHAYSEEEATIGDPTAAETAELNLQHLPQPPQLQQQPPLEYSSSDDDEDVVVLPLEQQRRPIAALAVENGAQNEEQAGADNDVEGDYVLVDSNSG